jgi:hypothetical protein
MPALWAALVASPAPCHKRDQRVPDGLLHGVLGRSIEGEVVDHRAYHRAAVHEVADGVAHVLVFPAEPVHLMDDQGVASAELLEPPHVVRLEAAKPLAPRVDRLFADPVPLGYRRHSSRSASRMIATICSSVKRALRIAPSESGIGTQSLSLSAVRKSGGRSRPQFVTAPRGKVLDGSALDGRPHTHRSGGVAYMRDEAFDYRAQRPIFKCDDRNRPRSNWQINRQNFQRESTGVEARD